MIGFSQRTTRRVLLTRLAVTTMLVSGFAAPALAETSTPAPVRQSVDANGVDLFLGTLNVNGPALTVGDAKTPSLSYYETFRGSSSADNVNARLYLYNGTVTVSFGTQSDRFTVSGSNYVSTEGNGATLTFNATTTTYTYTTADDVVYHFKNLFGSNGATSGLNDVVYPSGRTLSYTYAQFVHCTDHVIIGNDPPPPCTHYAAIYSLSKVTSSDGYELDFHRNGDTAEFPGTFAGVSMKNLVTGSTVRSQGYAVVDVDTAFVEITDAMGRVTKYRLALSGVAGITLPGKTTEDVTADYDTSNRVSGVTTPAGTTTYAYADSLNVRTTTVTDSGGHATVYKFNTVTQRMTSVTNPTPIGGTTGWLYDPQGRLTRATAPEGNYTDYAYDTRGNVTSTTQVSKTPGTPANIVTSASYPTTCSNLASCNKPTWTKDANGNQTDYTYDVTTGNVLSVKAPAPSGSGTRPTTTYGYSTIGGAHLLTGISTCQTAASCVGAADEVRTTIGYNTNLLPATVTQAAGNGSVSATTTIGYDDVGNRTSVDGPLSGTADTTTWRYDADRELTGVISADPDGSGSLKRRAERFTYNDDSQLTETETGTVNDTTDAAWSAFVTKQQLVTAFDTHGRKTSDKLTASGTTYGVTQYSYDSAGRLDCSAVRMNNAAWGTLPASACTAQTAGSAGPDRISKVASYDALNRVSSVTTAFGQLEASTESTSYTLNGQTASVTDAEGNKTSYSYDGFDRLVKTQYPSPTKGAGTSSATDYEQLGYDANGNVTSRQLRDGTSIAYTYDDLNRLIAKNLPGGEPDVSYGYDLLGRPTSVTQTGNALTFSYDALSQLLSETGPQGTLTSTWDAAGRRTKLAWPDGFYVNYDYDTLGEMTAVRENNATSGVGMLASYSYDDLGNRTGATFGNGTTSTWTPDAASQLASLSHNLAGSTYDLTRTFSYNPAGGIARAANSNDTYAWNAAANVDRNYTANGLDQYTVSGTTALGYDTRGNLTTSGSDSYTYSSENLLKTGPGGTSLSYDPLLRLYQVTQGTSTTRFDYDGLALVAEYDASSAMTKRYVYGPGTDEPIVQYDGAGTTSRSWLAADERGSVIAMTDSAGNETAIDSYDEYGIPGSANTGRFQYTGQAWIPELGIYYYKARMYSPSLGRFMQTDPIGYADGLNWYNYVGGDPVNFVDPTGLDAHCGTGYHSEPTHGGDSSDSNEITVVSQIRCVRDPGGGGFGGFNHGSANGGNTSAGGKEGSAQKDIVVTARRSSLQCGISAGITLGIDALGFGVSFLPGEKAAVALGGLALSSLAVTNSSVHGDLVGLTGAVAGYHFAAAGPLARQLESSASTSLGRKIASYVPVVGSVLAGGTLLYDAYKAPEEYKKCLSGK